MDFILLAMGWFHTMVHQNDNTLFCFSLSHHNQASAKDKRKVMQFQGRRQVGNCDKRNKTKQDKNETNKTTKENTYAINFGLSSIFNSSKSWKQNRVESGRIPPGPGIKQAFSVYIEMISCFPRIWARAPIAAAEVQSTSSSPLIMYSIHSKSVFSLISSHIFNRVHVSLYDHCLTLTKSEKKGNGRSTWLTKRPLPSTIATSLLRMIVLHKNVEEALAQRMTMI